MNIKLFLKKKLRKFLQAKWNVGFIILNTEMIMHSNSLDIIWLKHDYKDRWFADPFILDITERQIILLVEEFYFPHNKGRIARLTIDRESFRLEKSEVVLELETHLSFPILFRDRNDIYIYPENGYSGKLTVYKYSKDDNKVISVSSNYVLVNEPFADAIINDSFRENNIFYLFMTKLPYKESIGKRLYIYKSNKWNGSYIYDHSVEFKENIARNAGNLFYYSGKLIRPAQNCNDGYGKGLVFQEVEFNHGKYEFKEIKRFYPDDKKYNEALHTFNVSEDKNLIVVDGCYIPIINKIFRTINTIRVQVKRKRGR